MWGVLLNDASLVCCVRVEDHSLLADFYFAVLETTSTLVHVQDSTGSGLLCVDKPEGARNRAFAEQALADAYNHRKLPDAQCIDEIALEQGLEEVAAAVDLNLAAILCLELRDLLGNVALEQVRVVPGDLFERPRSDELRPASTVRRGGCTEVLAWHGAGAHDFNALGRQRVDDSFGRSSLVQFCRRES